MRFKKGEKVIVRTYKIIPINWNSEMFELMGEVVTIKAIINHNRDWPYTIEEAHGWVWREQDFISLLDSTNDPNYAFMLRRRNND